MSTPETPATPATVRVWDPLVRIFHWSLVVTFAIAYVTGENETAWHDWAGYAVLGLIAVRIAWGFVGTRYARFSDFVHRPAVVLGHARDMLSGRARRYLGHNPLGGVMILALLASLLASGVTGMALQAAEHGTGPLAGLASADTPAMPDVIASAVADDDEGEDGEEENNGGEEFWEELHEFFAHLTLLLVALHVIGVIVGSLAHRENLVRAMITGRKRV